MPARVNRGVLVGNWHSFLCLRDAELSTTGPLFPFPHLYEIILMTDSVFDAVGLAPLGHWPNLLFYFIFHYFLFFFFP